MNRRSEDEIIITEVKNVQNNNIVKKTPPKWRPAPISSAPKQPAFNEWTAKSAQKGDQPGFTRQRPRWIAGRIAYPRSAAQDAQNAHFEWGLRLPLPWGL